MINKEFKEFKINDYLTLKLENDKTILYVNGERFDHCKYLLLNVPVKEIESINDVKSIDEAAERLDKSLDPPDEFTRLDKIAPETEFWGHCSNLQAWYENDYDTRLLHRNLAFSLLEALANAGDLVARMKFKEEIAERYNNGTESIREYLEDMEYLDFLTREEFFGLAIEEHDIIGELQALVKEDDDMEVDIKKGKVISLYMEGKIIKDFPEPIRRLKYLEELILRYVSIKEIPVWIGELITLKELKISGSEIKEVPKSICKLERLETLKLHVNKLKSLPESIGSLRSLKTLDMEGNKLENLPESFGNLQSLTVLELQDNELKTLPESIGNLKSLEQLIAHHNRLETLPESIGNLKSLYKLILRNNNIKSLPESLGDLENLVNLSLNDNELTSLPNFTGKFASLGILKLENNPLSALPDAIFEHPRISNIRLRCTNVTLTKRQEEAVKRKKIDLLL